MQVELIGKFTFSLGRESPGGMCIDVMREDSEKSSGSQHAAGLDETFFFKSIHSVF